MNGMNWAARTVPWAANWSARAAGFLMFYAEDRSKLREAMAAAGLEEVRFHFDFEGTKVLLT